MADAEFDIYRFPSVVDHREQRLILPGERLKMAKPAEIGVVLDCCGPAFGKIISDPRRRREIE